MTTYEHVYDGLDAMTAAADAGVKAGRVNDTSVHPAINESFIGRQLADWTDVKAKLNEAWPEGLDEVQWMLFELRKATLPPVTCHKRRPRFADDGDEIDQDRLRSGQDYWRTLRRESVTGPQNFCIVTDMGTLSRVDAKDILWRGAVAIVLADLLEEQGHRVELWAACRQRRTYYDGSGSFQAVCLKRPDQPVDISTLTNAVSGWCYRTLFFQDRASEPRSKMRESAGHSIPLSVLDRCVAKLAGNARMIAVSQVWSKDAAVAFASGLLQNLDHPGVHR
jgi:hypothetical protein